MDRSCTARLRWGQLVEVGEVAVASVDCDPVAIIGVVGIENVVKWTEAGLQAALAYVAVNLLVGVIDCSFSESGEIEAEQAASRVGVSVGYSKQKAGTRNGYIAKVVPFVGAKSVRDIGQGEGLPVQKCWRIASIAKGDAVENRCDIASAIWVQSGGVLPRKEPISPLVESRVLRLRQASDVKIGGGSS